LNECEGKTWFLISLPATYDECGRIIREAVTNDQRIDIGPLVEEPDYPKRPIAHYQAYDGTVELYGKTYRAIVVHSSTHDKRCHKRIDRLLKQDRKQLETHCKQATIIPYNWHADAKAAGEKLIHKSETGYHLLQVEVKEVPKYSRGRSTTGKSKQVLHYKYRLITTIVEAPEKVLSLR